MFENSAIECSSWKGCFLVKRKTTNKADGSPTWLITTTWNQDPASDRPVWRTSIEKSSTRHIDVADLLQLYYRCPCQILNRRWWEETFDGLRVLQHISYSACVKNDCTSKFQYEDRFSFSIVATLFGPGFRTMPSVKYSTLSNTTEPLWRRGQEGW